MLDGKSVLSTLSLYDLQLMDEIMDRVINHAMLLIPVFTCLQDGRSPMQRGRCMVEGGGNVMDPAWGPCHRHQTA